MSEEWNDLIPLGVIFGLVFGVVPAVAVLLDWLERRRKRAAEQS